MSLYFDKPRLKGINASRGQAALICEDRNTAAGEIHKTANWSFTARRGRIKQKNKTENIYLNEPSCRLVENGRAPLRYARTEIPIFFQSFLLLPWVPEAFHARIPVSVKSFKKVNTNTCRPATDETKLPVAREKKPLVPRVSFCTFVFFFRVGERGLGRLRDFFLFLFFIF